jgi:hypothetical protein
VPARHVVEQTAAAELAEQALEPGGLRLLLESVENRRHQRVGAGRRLRLGYSLLSSCIRASMR